MNGDKIYAVNKRQTVSFNPLKNELVRSHDYLDKSFERTLTVSIGYVRNVIKRTQANLRKISFKILNKTEVIFQATENSIKY